MKKTNRLIYLSIILAMVFTLLGGSQAWAATATASQSGNWSDAATWGGTLPTSADNIDVSTFTVTVDGDYTVVNVVVGAGGILQPKTTGTYTLTIKGTVTNNAAALIDGVNSNGRLNIIFSNSAVKAITAGAANTIEFNNLTIAEGSSITIDNSCILWGDLVLENNASFVHGTAGAFTVSGTNSTITKATLGTLTFYNLTIAATATNVTTASDFTVSVVFTVASGGKFNASAGTITNIGTGVATPVVSSNTASDLSFYNVAFTATAAVTPATSFQVKGNFTKTGAAAYTASAGTVEFDNTASINSPKTITANSLTTFFRLKVTDGSNVKTASAITFSGTAGTSDFTIEGTGTYVSASSTTITGAAQTWDISNSGLLQLNDLIFANAATGFTTSSSLVLTGNLTVGSGSTIFTTPSVVAFKDTTNSLGTKTITTTAAGTLTFNNLYIYDHLSQTNVQAAAVGGAETIGVTGNINVYGNSILDFATNSRDVVLSGTPTKTIYNEGTLSFYDLSLAAAAGNLLTESNFTITHQLDCVNGNGTTASLSASGSSIITLSFGGMPFINAADETAYKFQSIKVTGALVATACEITIKGDLIVGTGGSVDMDGAATLVKFAGTSQQKIIGNIAALDKINVDNSAGLVLEGNILLLGATTTASCLTITNGSVDLNGNYYIQLGAVACTIAETGGFVKNTKPGTGYIATATGCSAAQINSSLIGVTGLATTANAQVKRFYGIRKIDGLESITRYYYFNDAGGNGTGILNLKYDASELNGNTEEQLTAYFSDNADAYLYDNAIANADATTDVNWTYTSATVTAASDIVVVEYSGNLIPRSATAFDVGYYMIAPAYVKLSYFPTTAIDKQNMNAESPLVAGNTSKTILTFKMETTKDFATADVFSALNVNLNRTPSGIFSNFVMKKDANNNVSSYTLANPTGGAATGSLTGNTVQFASLGEDLAAGTPVYYFIQADVDATVNSSTPSIFASINQDDITANNIYMMPQTINGPSYSFGNLNTTVSSSNSPSAGPLSIGDNDQTVFGFKLRPPAGSSVTFENINIKVTFANGALYNDFSTWQLWIDKNNNGIKDATDNTQIGSDVVTIDQTTGILTFTTTTTLIAGEDMNFILITDVKTSATANGTVKCKISSYADVTLTSPATVPTGGPYEGNTMTVRSSSGTPTKLSITAFSLADLNPGGANADYDLKTKGDNEVIASTNLILQVKAVDANGRSQKVDQATTVTLTPLGGGTVNGNNTISVSINATTGSVANFQLTTASTANNFSLIASTTAGTSLAADTLTDIRVFSSEPPAFQISALAAASITASTSALSWTNGGAYSVIVVMKANGWPTDPEDGVSYNSSANFLTPASSNGTTGTGSVVVYKGAGTSVNLTGLSANTTYYVKVYQYNGSGIGTNYMTWDVLPNGTTFNSFGDQVQFTTTSEQPTANSSNLTFTSVTDNSMKLTWDKPATGGGTNSIVVVGKAAFNGTINDTTTYTASSVYGEGTAIGNGFVAYNGTGNTVTLTGLSSYNRYYVRVYEFNGTSGNENYLTTGYLSGDRYTLDFEPTIQASNISFSDMTLGANTSVRVNFVRGNGEAVVVVGKAGAPIGANETPSDQTIEYTTESSVTPTFGTTTSIGQGYLLFVGTANSITVGGLQYGQTYYFKAFEFNAGGVVGAGNTTVDNSTLNYATADATDNPNSRIADSYEPNDALANSKFVLSNGTLVSGLLSSADDADWFSFRPDFANDASSIRIKLTGLPKNYTLELYRADGRLLRRSKILGTSDEIVVLNNLPEADYYIKIYSADGEYSLTPYRVNVLNRTSDYQSDTQ